MGDSMTQFGAGRSVEVNGVTVRILPYWACEVHHVAPMGMYKLRTGEIVVSIRDRSDLYRAAGYMAEGVVFDWGVPLAWSKDNPGCKAVWLYTDLDGTKVGGRPLHDYVVWGKLQEQIIAALKADYKAETDALYAKKCGCETCRCKEG